MDNFEKMAKILNKNGKNFEKKMSKFEKNALFTFPLFNTAEKWLWKFLHQLFRKFTVNNPPYSTHYQCRWSNGRASSLIILIQPFSVVPLQLQLLPKY